MPRLLKRYYGADDLHYITCSCYKRRPLLAVSVPTLTAKPGQSVSTIGKYWNYE